MLDQARALFPIACRDLVTVIAAREDYESTLDAFARRRAELYAHPRSIPEESYWPTIASALAPIGPPEWMPMHGLIEHGITLEGGAKGLRGLFVREPSEKERRRVLKIATLVARVLELVVRSSPQPQPDETRLIAMTMHSFGLNADELAKTTPPSPLTFDNLEIFGDIDVRVRREILRGAWQLALACKLEPSRELVVRGIASRLELSAEADRIRAEVIEQQTRQGEMAIVAIELARTVARSLPDDVIRPWLEHLVTAAAPVVRKMELTALAFGQTSVESLPRLETSRRTQAIALALATLLGHDPTTSVALHLRAELTIAAEAAGAGGEVATAFNVVDRYLFKRVREIVQTAAPDPTTTPPT